MNRPRTLQIFLPNGDPSSLRVAEQTTSIMRLIEAPRRDLAAFLELDESKQVGVYFLIIGENKDHLYIGQSGEVGKRLMRHHQEDKKDWDRALVLVSLTQNLTQTHALYLESLSIEKAKACGRYELTNGNQGQAPHTPIPLKADCEEMHEIGRLLLTTLGYPVFEPLSEPNKTDDEVVFYCTRAGVEGRGLYTNEGMVVLKGSKSPAKTDRKTEPRLVELRRELLEKGVLSQQGDSLVFERDYLCKTPSGASCLLLQAASNGWTDWKTEQGITLHDHQGRDLGEQA